MTYIVFFTIVLLIALLGVFLSIENSKKKAELLKKQIFVERQNHAVSQFKNQIPQYIEAKILRPKHSHNIQAIASNFFVVQAHNEDNLAVLEATLESLTTNLNSELAKTNITGDKETITNNIITFINELPKNARDFNHEFYSQIMPALIVTLQTPDLSFEETTEENEQVQLDQVSEK
ncbi:hypothetical protein CJF42_10780 [Pseudoalteromonas sp. NBT06-2]|uniref:hypothetical protein n=1 Tax=Pseudoalteromonas sp. NBT06-2 TaxID=2025950 RepID=UPI000BA58C65|nr:hypothetical protein [Pseudoalteromonas sp. NBT06-2]PAJ74379.1 hypothetical protein CJF42_10780 [Pseudoalteromonas sp. NBT06-2]